MTHHPDNVKSLFKLALVLGFCFRLVPASLVQLGFRRFHWLRGA